MLGKDEYFVIADIPHVLFQLLLNLPEGFEVEAFQDTPMEGSVKFKIRCPKEPRFLSPRFGVPKQIEAMKHFEKGVITHLTWPDLK